MFEWLSDFFEDWTAMQLIVAFGLWVGISYLVTFVTLYTKGQKILYSGITFVIVFLIVGFMKDR